MTKAPVKLANTIAPKIIETSDFDQKAIEASIKDGEKAAEMELNFGDVQPFPLEVFPKFYQNLVKEANRVKKFPIDYFAASLMFATGAAMGNEFKLRVQDSYFEKAAIWLMLVGRPNTMKSPPLDWIMQPFWDRHEFLFDDYQMKQDIGATNFQLVETILKDYTPEALVKSHRINRKGIVIHNDEICNWIDNFKRYSSGGSEPGRWLESWNFKQYGYSRSERKIFVKDTFLPVIGTTQFAAIKRRLSENGLFENGFWERFLFVAPNGLKKESRSKENLPPQYYQQYVKNLEKLWGMAINEKISNPNLFCNFDTNIITLSPEAEDIILNWCEGNNERCNKADERLSSLYGKFDMHIYRLAMMLQGMMFVCDDAAAAELTEITPEAAHGAVKLANYFLENTNKMYNYFNSNSQILKLNKDVLIWYNSLNRDEVSTAQAIETARTMTRKGAKNLSDAQVYRYLSEKHIPQLFKPIGKAIYRKIW